MKANLILNGDIDLGLLEKELSTDQEIYVADGAYDKVLSLNLPIKAILGDLDSLKSRDSNIKTIELKDQNFTDFYKSLKYLEKSYQEIKVFGASGGDLDHCLGNLFAASCYVNRIIIKFIDPKQRYFITDKSVELKKVKNKTISFIPFTKITNLTTVGLKYELKNQNLDLNKMISIRNTAMIDDVLVNFDSGKIIVFISTDVVMKAIKL